MPRPKPRRVTLTKKLRRELARARKGKQLTVDELAELVGMHRTTLARLESGETETCGRGTLMLWRQQLGLSI